MAHELPQNIGSESSGLFFGFGEWANTVSGGLFWILMLVGFSFALFMATARFGSRRAFGFASFTLMIGAMFLAILTFISWWIASAFIIIGVVGLALMMLSDK